MSLSDAAVNRKTSNSVKRPGRLKLLLISLGTGTLLLFGYRKYKANTEREPKLATNKQVRKMNRARYLLQFVEQ